MLFLLTIFRQCMMLCEQPLSNYTSLISSHLTNCRNLWNHMTKTAIVFMLTSEMMSSQLDHHSYLAVKELLGCPTWRYSHDCPFRQHTTDLPEVVTGQGENFEIAGTHIFCVYSYDLKRLFSSRHVAILQ